MSTLQSPGVSVSLIDDSAYVSASASALQTVPLIIAATRRNKQLDDGTIAPGTTTEAANKLHLVTSREDFRNRFGIPHFRNVNGVPIHGDETNEYGMQAAWNVLDVINRAYIMPVDIDLDQLEGSADEPVRDPEDGTYWMDTSRTRIALFQWNDNTSAWESQDLYVLDDEPGTGDVQSVQNGAADPKNTFGLNGDFAVVTSAIPFIVWEKVGGTWIMLGAEAHPQDFQMAPHTRVPSTRADGSPLEHGDLYIQTTSSANGSFFDISMYESASGNFITKQTPILMQGDDALDYYVGLGGVTEGDVFIQMDHEGQLNPFYNYDPARPQYSDGVGVFTPMVHSGDEFTVATSKTDIPNIDLASYPVSQVIINGVTVTFDVTTSSSGTEVTAEDIITHLQTVTDLKTLGLRFNLEGSKITIVNTTGKDITVQNVGEANVDWTPNTMTDVAAVLGFRYSVTQGLQLFRKSNWSILPVVASEVSPTREAEEGTLWFSTNLRAEILESYFDTNTNSMQWRTKAWSEDPGGLGISSALIIRGSQPTDADLGDIWLDSTDLENYPSLHRLTASGWVQIDNTDQNTSQGILFANYAYDAPFSENGTPRPSTAVNEFAPNAEFFSEGILLFNMDYSTYNVKEYRGDGEWISVSGVDASGVPYMGRKAQRRMIVRVMREAIINSKELRNRQRFMNLLSTPGYVELLPQLNALNSARKETGFVVTSVPIRMPVDSNTVQNWVDNTANAQETGEDALTEFNRMSALYAFSGLQVDATGSQIAMPGDAIALETIIRSDRISYPWLAPAGYTRGQVFNTTALGHVENGEFVVAEFDDGIIDNLYINNINPIVTFAGEGNYVWGQKTLQPFDTAMDRINVARLVAYLRFELERITRPFVFQPNDAQTRQEVQTVVEQLITDVIDKRGITDALVVCDESNNTQARIDRNELYVDVAISPTKAAEFIYIPITLQRTGEVG